MTIKFTDNALSKLAADITSTDTVISITPGDGTLYPAVDGTDADYFVITLEDASGNREFVRVDHRSGDTFGSATYPCVRGYWGSTALGFSASDTVVDLRWSANAITTLFGSYVQTSGDTMTGPLVLPADPTSALEAATKQYVDNGDAARVAKAGDTMTGALVLPADPTNALEAATKQYVDGQFPVAVANGGTGATDAATARANLQVVEAQGQCYLTYVSATQLRLDPKNGNALYLYDGTNWVRRTIPSGGVTLGAPAAANTTYYIYAYDNAGSVALEASTTGHATDSASGFEIKSGDATRLLVGMARSNASTQWQDDSSFIGVLSWYNRRWKVADASNTSDIISNNNSYHDLGISVGFLVWDRFLGWVHVVGYSSDSVGGIAPSGTANIGAQEKYDASNGFFAQMLVNGNGNYWGFARAGYMRSLSEGWHTYAVRAALGNGASVYVKITAGQARALAYVEG